jgi:sRNA-binding regulator protein Hfq
MGGRPGAARQAGGPRRREEFDAVESDEILSGPVEANYLKELVSARTPIEVKLRNGETHSGTLEYWDQRFIRLTPEKGPNLFIFKHDIKYLLEK